MMKLILIALIIATILFSSENCFAQTIIVDEKPSKIFLQIQVRNSEGKLISYQEPTVMYMFRPDLVDSLLATKQHHIITKDGKTFEQIQYEEHSTFFNTHTYAQYRMWYDYNGENIQVLTFLHDGYNVVPGDTISALWTVEKPLN